MKDRMHLKVLKGVYSFKILLICQILIFENIHCILHITQIIDIHNDKRIYLENQNLCILI